VRNVCPNPTQLACVLFIDSALTDFPRNLIHANLFIIAAASLCTPPVQTALLGYLTV